MEERPWWQDAWEWITSWNEPGTLGDFLPWFLSGVLALILFIWRLRLKRREQALQVTGWVDQLPNGQIVARVRNGSTNSVKNLFILVAKPGDAPEDDNNGQILTMMALGPQRTADLPIRVDENEKDQYLVRLHFDDHSGKAWIADEGGTLKRQRHSAPIKHLGGLTTGQRASVVDESGTLTQEGKAPELAKVAVDRTDLDPADGHNVTVKFLAPGAKVTPGTVVELWKEEHEGLRQNFVRAYFDGDEHLVGLTICNLPSVRDRPVPHERKENNQYFMLFGKSTQTFASLMEEIGDESSRKVILGDKHATLPGAPISLYFSGSGNLLGIQIPASQFMPGFIR